MRRRLAALAASVLFVSCGSTAPTAATTTTTTTTTTIPQHDVRWIAISAASATHPSATSLMINIDACDVVPAPRVEESATEVHLLIDKQHDYAGVQLMCLGGTIVHLAQPIGDRTVVDDRNGRRFTVTMNPPVTIAHLVGSVGQVLGREGDATVTGWLVVDNTAAGVMCDELPASATTCTAQKLDVDWTAGNAALPSDLVPRGTVRVSRGPITLRGSLKGDILFVGIVP